MPFNPDPVLPLPQILDMLVPGGRHRAPAGMRIVYRPKTGKVMLHDKSSLTPRENREFMDYLRVSVGKELTLRSPGLSPDQLSQAVENALAPVFKANTARGADIGKLFEIHSGPPPQLTASAARTRLQRDRAAAELAQPPGSAAARASGNMRRDTPVRSAEELASRQIQFRRMVWGLLHETQVCGEELIENIQIARQYDECAADAASLIQDHIDVLARFKTPVFEKPAKLLLAGRPGHEVFANAAGEYFTASSDLAHRLASKEAAHQLLYALCSLPPQQLSTIRMPANLLRQLQRANKSLADATPYRMALASIMQRAGVDSRQVFETLKLNLASRPGPQAEAPATPAGEAEDSLDPFDRMVQELDEQAARMEPGEQARIFSSECVLTAYFDEMLPKDLVKLSIPGMEAAPDYAKKMDQDPRLAQLAVELVATHMDWREHAPGDVESRHLNSAIAMLLPPTRAWDHEYLPMAIVRNLAASVACWKDTQSEVNREARQMCRSFAASMSRMGRDADAVVAKLLENATLLERFKQSPLASAPQFKHLAPEYIIPLWVEMMAAEQSAAEASAAAIEAGADAPEAGADAPEAGPDAPEAWPDAREAAGEAAADAREAGHPVDALPSAPGVVEPSAHDEVEDEVKRPMPPTIKGAMPRADARLTVQDSSFYELGRQGPVMREPYVPTNHHDGSKSRKRSRALKLAIATENKIWMRAKAGDAQALRLWRINTYGADRVRD